MRKPHLPYICFRRKPRGVLHRHMLVGYGVFFVYAAAFMIFAFVTMNFVKHGDTKEGKTGLAAYDFDD